jgi:hypothetical protein
VSMQARKLELHVRNQPSAQDNIRTDIDALLECNMLKPYVRTPIAERVFQ